MIEQGNSRAASPSAPEHDRSMYERGDPAAEHSTSDCSIAVERLGNLRGLTARLSAAFALNDVAALALTDMIELVRARAADIAYVEREELVVLHAVGFGARTLE